MAIVCPYCSHSLTVKTPRAGRFTPRCSKCNQTFQLTVVLEPEPKFTAVRIPAATSAPAFDPSLTAPSRGDAPVAAPPFDPDLTAPAEAGAPASIVRPAPAVLGETMPPLAGVSDTPDFSVSPSAVSSKSASPDVTTALPDTSAPSLRQRAGANLEATEAGTSDGDDEDREMPAQLGNYQIIKELGRGGMGAVYLARQVTLDRKVALKVMNSQWASNPKFLVRFTREAYAAAQLVHHNVVQVYDIGADKGMHYFSMEFVEGQSLGDLLKKEGKIAPEAAAGYILQAARGLAFAHERGMVHRDVKPDNLMLNAQGIVKVADLGLVRTPGLVENSPAKEAPEKEAPPRGPSAATRGGAGRSLSSLSNITQANQAMGTPSYMSPEQARDSTKIDHRADIYSLGCTLYVMVTGRPVFQGSNALEVITKHATEPIVRPDVIVKDVPKAMGDVVVKMMAKKPEDRYASMDEVVNALEAYLGLHGVGKLDQAEQHVRTLEQGIKAFHGSPLAALRPWLVPAFFAGCTVLALILLFFGAWRTAGTVFALGVLTGAASFLVRGAAQRTYLFLEVRELVLSSSWLDLVKVVAGGLLITGMACLILPWWVVVLAAVLAVGLAFGLHYGIDRRIAAQRTAALEKVELMLKTLRLRGLSEDALQEFVCKYSGEQWEEFFEALFGYESKLAARQRYGIGPKGPRPKFAAWRDPVIRWIEQFQRSRQEARERKHLQKIEQESLRAQGMDAAQARHQAECVAEAMVQKAAEIKQAPMRLDATVAPEQGGIDTKSAGAVAKAPVPKRINVQDIYKVADQPVQAGGGRSALSRSFASLFGPGVRFMLGAALLLVCLMWMRTRGLLPRLDDLDTASTYTSVWERARDAVPLDIPLVPENVRLALAGSINPGVAGILLILSALWGSWKIGVVQLAAAAVMVVGPVAGVPEVGPLTPQLLCLAVGAGLSTVGFLFGRDT